MIDALRNSVIVGCPVVVEDVIRAEHIFGSSVPILKGKTIDHGPTDVRQISVRRNDRELQVMYSDIMYVFETPMLLSVFKPLNLVMASEVLVKRSSQLVAESILSQVRKLRANGFDVCQVFVDGESSMVSTAEPLAEHRLEVVRVGTGEHVTMVERVVRVLKERVRCVLIELPWKFPKALIKWLIYYCVTRIN